MRVKAQGNILIIIKSRNQMLLFFIYKTNPHPLVIGSIVSNTANANKNEANKIKQKIIKKKSK